MPYQIPDPDAPRLSGPEAVPAPAPSAEEAEILRELSSDETFKAAQKMIGELAEPIESARQQENAEARARVAATPEFVELRRAGMLARDAFLAFEDAHRQAARDPNLSLKGREDRDRREREKLDTRLAEIAERVLSGLGDSLLKQFPPAPAILVPEKLAPSVAAIFAGADHHLPEALLSRAAEALRIATDPASDSLFSDEARHLLDAAYLPLMTRFAGAPPKHWVRWAPLAGQLAELVRVHLDTRFNRRASHRVATEAVQAFRRDFTFLVGACRNNNNTWDDVIAVGAPAFAWGELSRAA